MAINIDERRDMMKSACFSYLSLFAFFLFLASPTSAAAQECDMCDLGPTNYHSFGGGGGLYTCQWSGGCHSSVDSGHCGDKHWVCTPDEEDVDEVQHLQSVLASGDDSLIQQSLVAAV